eukprot:TRINITY_DN1091_c0_g1_i1.p1 TRINITY_DN1091_c0_g1~~TRINITY_DN1091_c0_g1_i1.p1  ORF type:complete len:369 (-),score=-3.70 TRINITY_DN1091_c0_g1_i1:122-1123(-)
MEQKKHDDTNKGRQEPSAITEQAVKLARLFVVTDFIIRPLSNAIFYYPLETLKTICQLSTLDRSSLPAFKSQGYLKTVRSLYKGMGAYFLRHTFYTTFISWYVLKPVLKLVDPYTKVKIEAGRGEKLLEDAAKSRSALVVSLLSAVGAGIFMPIDTAYVRQQSELALSPTKGYKGTFNTMHKILVEEGHAALWRGIIPTMAKYATISYVFFDLHRKVVHMLKSQWNIHNYLVHSSLTGFIAATLCLPLDYLKVKLQTARVSEGSNAPNIRGILIEVLKGGKVTKLWAGLFPYAGSMILLTLLLTANHISSAQYPRQQFNQQFLQAHQEVQQQN